MIPTSGRTRQQKRKRKPEVGLACTTEQTEPQCGQHSPKKQCPPGVYRCPSSRPTRPPRAAGIPQ
eukprot:6866510-Pyramimonas_sp.AAC.1